MRILLLGAAGRVGSLTLQKALAEGHTVYAFARTPSKLSVPPEPERCIHIKGDAMSAADVDAAFAEARPEAVISTIGIKPGAPMPPEWAITMGNTYLAACRKHGTKRLIMLGGVQVLEEGDQLPFMFRAFRLLFLCMGAGPALRDASRFLKVLRATEDIDWTFVRPTAFKDGPSKVKKDVALEMYAGPVSGVGGTIQTVDLAAWMVAHVATGGPWKQAAPAVSNLLGGRSQDAGTSSRI